MEPFSHGVFCVVAGDTLDGEVVVMGCPADEIHAPETVARGSGKALSATAGAWDDIDAAMYVHQEFIEQLDRDLELWLPEVAELPVSIRTGVELIASFDAWDRLREEQGLGPRQAIGVLEATLARLIGLE